MRSRRPIVRLNRGRVPRRLVVSGEAPPATLLSLEVSDPYVILGTWDGTPPADANYSVAGTPEFIVGVTTGATTRAWQMSGPILDTETVALSSDVFSAEAVTNSSTEAGADYTTNLLFELDARTGLTHTGDGTTITAAADQSGNGYNFVEIETGQGPIYHAAIAQMRGLPMIDCSSNDALQSTAAGLITALTGAVPFTLVMLWCPSGNNNTSRVCSWGQKNAAGNHYVDVCSTNGSGNPTFQSLTNGVGANNTRTANNRDQYQKKPLASMVAWSGDASTITAYAGRLGTPVTYDSSVFTYPSSAPNTLAIGAQLRALSPNFSNGSMRFARMRLYGAVLTAAQLRQVGREMADGYGVPMLGCSPARALSLV